MAKLFKKEESISSKMKKATYERIIKAVEENAEEDKRDLRFKLWLATSAAAGFFTTTVILLATLISYLLSTPIPSG